MATSMKLSLLFLVGAMLFVTQVNGIAFQRGVLPSKVFSKFEIPDEDEMLERKEQRKQARRGINFYDSENFSKAPKVLKSKSSKKEHYKKMTQVHRSDGTEEQQTTTSGGNRRK